MKSSLTVFSKNFNLNNKRTKGATLNVFFLFLFNLNRQEIKTLKKKKKKTKRHAQFLFLVKSIIIVFINKKPNVKDVDFVNRLFYSSLFCRRHVKRNQFNSGSICLSS